MPSRPSSMNNFTGSCPTIRARTTHRLRQANAGRILRLHQQAERTRSRLGGTWASARSSTRSRALSSVEKLQRQSYGFIRATRGLMAKILDDPKWFEEYLTRHNIVLPNEPPIPRRYIGDGSWAVRNVTALQVSPS